MATFLRTYLNDHLAGSTLGVELARRASRNNRGTAYGQELAQLTREIEEDRETLKQIMRRLEVTQDRAKVALAWCAEKVVRLKPNGRLLSYSPLSRLEELEALAIGVEGKGLLWQALAEARGSDPRLADFDLPALRARADSQQHRIEMQRLRASDEALR